MVDFFNEHEMPVTVSWDGFNVNKTRGYDVFAGGTRQRELLLGIKRLGLSAVMSSMAYPLEILEAFQVISDAYYEIHGYHVSINIDEVFDTGCLPKDLLAIDFDRVEQEMFELSKFYLEKRTSGEQSSQHDFTKLVYMERMFSVLKSFYFDGNGTYKQNYCSCGNGYNVLNLDLSGKLYACHNTSTSIGSITDNYFVYLSKLLESDPTLKNKERCSECPAIAFCRGGCKLVSDKARKESYCR